MKTLLGIVLVSLFLGDGDVAFKTVSVIPVPEAKQAVAADATHFYAIDDAVVAKYNHEGKREALWSPEPSSHIKHLNSGFIKDGKLYMAHSNYPALPRTSTIEILDTKTMKHVKTHEFGVYDGAANWVLWHNNAWWVLFAHYSGKVAEPNRTAADTRIDRFDANWKKLGSYTFPDVLVQKFQPKSISGGSFGPDGYLYCTGHDATEVYRLAIPKQGTVLEYKDAAYLPCEGQGIAWYGDILYGIRRSTREVIISTWRKK